MNKINIGLIGCGVVGEGVLKLLKEKRATFRKKFHIEYVLKALCDRQIKKKNTKGLKGTQLTTNYKDVINNDEIDVVIELIGGMNPAKAIVTESLKQGKHVITANKELIANCGKELFTLARKHRCHLYFESSVGAGMPVIQTITEGIAGNAFSSVYGIINGTCNYILSEMTRRNLTFGQALKDAQKKGYAERNPTLDINGMDSTHKLAILVNLAFGKFLKVKDIYTEGITEISHDDIEYAESLNLCIKLLAIAKKENNRIEARVHPTLISKDHPLSSINGVNNAVFMHTQPLGDIMLSGEGAGQKAAASGVISDLLNLASQGHDANLHSNIYVEDKRLKLKGIDETKTKFYLRFMALDKPGVLSKITGILGRAEIGINSVTQRAHNRANFVPIIMLTDYTTEKKLRTALNRIDKLPISKGRPVAIRMEKLA